MADPTHAGPGRVVDESSEFEFYGKVFQRYTGQRARGFDVGWGAGHTAFLCMQEFPPAYLQGRRLRVYLASEKWTHKKSGQQMTTSFRDNTELEQYVMSVPESERSFYELLVDECRPYFDVDCSTAADNREPAMVLFEALDGLFAFMLQDYGVSWGLRVTARGCTSVLLACGWHACRKCIMCASISRLWRFQEGRGMLRIACLALTGTVWVTGAIRRDGQLAPDAFVRCALRCC